MPSGPVVECVCGRRFQAIAQVMGQTVSCPACQQPLTIPSTYQSIFDDLPPGTIQPPRPARPPKPAMPFASQPPARRWKPHPVASEFWRGAKILCGCLLLLGGGLQLLMALISVMAAAQQNQPVAVGLKLFGSAAISLIVGWRMAFPAESNA
ncbi:MAG TPA: hypothetical protein VFV87_01480 [Pirellulaceae bacterium]|nr:hypothetical protein [Pirellulaceae bacterium]